MRPPRGVLRIKSSRVGPPRLIFTSNGLTSRASKGEARQLTGERAAAARSTLQSTVARNSVLRSSERHFYLWMAGVFVLMAFGGFTPTSCAPVASGTFHGPPILHIHGALLFSWTLFYFIQTAWIASGHTPTHRAWGLAGIALFSVMMCSILVAQITVMRLGDAHGYGDAARRFAAVPRAPLRVPLGSFPLA